MKYRYEDDEGKCPFCARVQERFVEEEIEEHLRKNPVNKED